MAVQKQKKNEQPQAESLIYIGPNLPKGVLTQSTIFRGGYPTYLENHFEECPAIKRLMVPVDQFTERSSKTGQTGTPEHIWFNEVLEHYYGGAK